MDNILSINLKSTQELLQEASFYCKRRRLSLKLTQEGLAHRSGVSWGSIKRFESTGQISLESLLKLALVLGFLQDFEILFNLEKITENQSLDEILKQKKITQRGKIK